jgi:hypothetical protein
MAGLDVDSLPTDRWLNVCYAMRWETTPERERDFLDERLAEPPPGWQPSSDTPLARRGRRPKGWGVGDDDAIEADSGLAALAVMRTVPR